MSTVVKSGVTSLCSENPRKYERYARGINIEILTMWIVKIQYKQYRCKNTDC